MIPQYRYGMHNVKASMHQRPYSGQGRAVAPTIPGRSGHIRYWWYWSMLPLLLLLAACSNGSGPTTSNVTPETARTATTVLSRPTSTQGVGEPGCKPASTLMQSAVGGPETQGTGRGMEVWALFFNDLQAGHDQKIVWRLTGDGDPQFTTTGPAGKHARVVFGPTAHSGSNWSRPGDEWGTGFSFPVAGCWDLHVTRGNAVGDVWLIIKG